MIFRRYPAAAGRGADLGIRELTGIEATESRTQMIGYYILHCITNAPELNQGKYTNRYDA